MIVDYTARSPSGSSPASGIGHNIVSPYLYEAVTHALATAPYCMSKLPSASSHESHIRPRARPSTWIRSRTSFAVYRMVFIDAITSCPVYNLLRNEYKSTAQGRQRDKWVYKAVLTQVAAHSYRSPAGPPKRYLRPFVFVGMPNRDVRRCTLRAFCLLL